MSKKETVLYKRFAAISFIMIVAFLFLPAEVSAIKPDKTYIKNPKDIGLEYESVTIQTKDGYDLQSWFMPAKSNDIKGTIIYSGGDAGNMSYTLDPLPMFVYNGYNVVTYDYRGFGGSEAGACSRCRVATPSLAA